MKSRESKAARASRPQHQHTHLLRGGYAQAAKRRALIGYNIRDPPLTRWVCPGR